jgi:hypothetical protein
VSLPLLECCSDLLHDSLGQSSTVSSLPSNLKITNPKSASAEHPQNFRHLRDWFLPTAAEKTALALEKGLTTNSVNLWYVNSFPIGTAFAPYFPFPQLLTKPLFFLFSSFYRFTNMRRRSVRVLHWFGSVCERC